MADAAPLTTQEEQPHRKAARESRGWRTGGIRYVRSESLQKY